MEDYNLNEIRNLIDTLNVYRDNYYNDKGDIVPDSQYDYLYEKLQKLEKSSGIIYSDSPTQTVGYEVKSKLEKVKHSTPLLSLDKTKSKDEVKLFASKQDCLIMYKYDGLTVEIIYDKGKLVQASTRGNGIIGEDITHNAKTFINLPTHIKYNGKLKVVGEAIIKQDDFIEINQNLSMEEKYKTPRNLVSGSVKQLDSSICANRKVHFMLWDVLESSFKTRSEAFEKMEEIGFNDIFYGFVDTEFSINLDCFKEMANKLNIPIDGLVFKYNDYSYSKSLGSTSHHNKDGIAYKFEDEQVTTTLRKIEWQVGSSGILTPVANFDMVEIDGTNVCKASLHNVSLIKELQLGIGDRICVRKANMIIPQIVDNLTKSNTYEYPKYCPQCNSVVEMKKINKTENLYCSNYDCLGKLIQNLCKFVSKDGLNIDGLSQSTIEILVDLGWIDSYIDVFYLKEKRISLLDLKRFGEKSVNKLLENIEKSKNTKLENFIYALNIPTVGQSTAKIISNSCNQDVDIFYNRITSYYKWNEIEGIGEDSCTKINDYCNSIISQITELLSILKLTKENTINANSKFKDKMFVVTGTLEHFTRSSIKIELEGLGAKVGNSVTNKTDYLIAGNSCGSKLQKAKEKNVTIITEQEFLNLI